MAEPLDYQSSQVPAASKHGCARQVQIAAGAISLLIGTALVTLLIAEAMHEGINDGEGVSLLSLVSVIAFGLLLAACGLYVLVGDRLGRAWLR